MQEQAEEGWALHCLCVGKGKGDAGAGRGKIGPALPVYWKREKGCRSRQRKDGPALPVYWKKGKRENLGIDGWAKGWKEGRYADRTGCIGDV